MRLRKPRLFRPRAMFRQWETPDYQQLLGEGFTCVDMHYHTCFSDGIAQIDEILEKAGQLGIGIAITDHNQISGCIEAAEKDEVLVIPGIEVTSRNAKDILLHFYDMDQLENFHRRYVRGNKEPNWGLNLRRLVWDERELLEAAQEYECLVSLPHPFANKPKRSFECFEGNSVLLDSVHAIEALNGILDRRRNNSSLRWAREVRKPIIGGSDGHTLKALGHVVTVSRESTVRGFLDSIKEGRNWVAGWEQGVVHKLASHMIILKNNLNLVGVENHTEFDCW